MESRHDVYREARATIADSSFDEQVATVFNRLFIDHYYQLEQHNGYSELGIVPKRAALENVLVPCELLENRELLLSAGFSSVDVFFKWYDSCGPVAVK